MVWDDAKFVPDVLQHNSSVLEAYSYSLVEQSIHKNTKRFDPLVCIQDLVMANDTDEISYWMYTVNDVCGSDLVYLWMFDVQDSNLQHNNVGKFLFRNHESPPFHFNQKEDIWQYWLSLFVIFCQ